MQLDPAVANTRPSNFSPVVLRMFGFTSCAEISDAHKKSAAKYDRNPRLKRFPNLHLASGVLTRRKSRTLTHTYRHTHTHTHTQLHVCMHVCLSVSVYIYTYIYIYTKCIFICI